MSLEPGQRDLQRVGRHWVTFEGCAGPRFDITAGELVNRLTEGTPVEPGTTVRVEAGQDGWYEVLIVRKVEDSRAPRRIWTAAAASATA